MLLVLAAAMTLQVQVFTPAAPPQTATQAARASAAPQDGEAEVIQICRNVPVTGSRFPRRVCRSQRQDQADRDESRDMLRNWQGLPELPGSSASPKGTGSNGPL